MKCYIENDRTGITRVEDREPECGKDFCDTCGDCLACYGGDPCSKSKDGKHLWVIYEEEVEEPETEPLDVNVGIGDGEIRFYEEEPDEDLL